jgi:hypothetical protein
MLQVNQDSLIQELKKMNLDPETQKETGQIYVMFKHEKREFPCFVRLLHEGELIQILTFIPTNVKPECFNDVSRFLHMINKELDMPGFCLDDASNTVFYRLILPTLNKQASEQIFDAFINTSQVVCKTFTQAIEAIANGLLTLEEVIKKAKENAKNG